MNNVLTSLIYRIFYQVLLMEVKLELKLFKKYTGSTYEYQFPTDFRIHTTYLLYQKPLNQF